MKYLQQNLFNKIQDKIDISIERIKFAYDIAVKQGKESLWGAFSGGKDSIVIAELLRLSGVKYTLNYNITGVDTPELIYFMRKNYPELKWHPYEMSMWQLIVKNGVPPTSLMRYCCSYLKERGGEGEFCITGVRWAESNNRKNNRKPFENNAHNRKESMLFNDNAEERRDFERCIPKSKIVINPIIDWTDEDVWNFIQQQKLPYCELYNQPHDYKRIGCIGCPLKYIKSRIQDFERYPEFKKLYIKAFDKALKEHKYRKQPTWKSGQEVFDWWMSR